MIRTTVVGSWPPETKFKQGLQNYFAGDLISSDIETLLNDAASVAIAQQKNCGLDEYTGGETSADTFILKGNRIKKKKLNSASVKNSTAQSH